MDLRATGEAADRAIARGACRSVQVCVRHGDDRHDHVAGRDAAGAPTGSHTWFPWLCATKPLGAVAVGQLVDRGLMTVDDPVVDLVPELRATVWEGVTVRHLLQHTTAVVDDPAAPTVPGRDQEATLAVVAGARRVPGARPGTVAAYSTYTSWYLLSLIVTRVHGRPFAEVVGEEVLGAVGAAGALALTKDQQRSRSIGWWLLDATRRADLPEGERGVYDGLRDQECLPGLSGIGPVSSLVEVFHAVAAARRDEGGLLGPATAALLVTASRTGLLDHVRGDDLTWGLGFVTDRRAPGVQLPDSFSHSGIGSSPVVVSVPDLDLTVGIAFDRPILGLRGLQRQISLMRAVLADVGVRRRPADPAPA